MKNRILALLLCLIIAVSLLPANALAANVVASGAWDKDMTWTLTDDGVLTISGTGDMFAPLWQNYRDVIKSVVIKEGVKSICNHAFYACSSLTSVEIPNSVTRIGYMAFSFCYSLKDISIPASVTEIGNFAFIASSSLTGIWIDENNGIYSSDDRGVLFNKDKSELICAPTGIRGDYIVPDSVKTIRESAFDYCELLTGVTIPDGVTEIISHTFYSCVSLKSVTIPESVKVIGEHAFFDCEALESVTIPESVTEIGDYAFDMCVSLTSITIPKNVTKIGNCAFDSCPALTGVLVDKDNPAYSNDDHGVLFDKDKTVLIKVPESMTGEYAIPDGVTEISENAFAGCKRLISVSIPEGVTVIGEHALSWCVSLKSITIPKSVTEIGNRCFYDCYSLTGITVDDDNPVYCSDSRGVLFDKEKTKLIEAPGGITGGYVIPDSVTDIGDSAFAFCVDLESVTIPAGVKNISRDVFIFCNRLRGVRFLGDAPTFEDEWIFEKVNGTVYYPAGNSTWADILAGDTQLYGSFKLASFDPDRKRGDVDVDGEIGNSDLILIARYVVEIVDPAARSDIEFYGDMEGDGKITNSDIINVARIIVGLE